MKGYRVSVTYEFDKDIQGVHAVTTEQATSFATAANRALKVAKQRWKGRKPQSVVVVLDRQGSD